MLNFEKKNESLNISVYNFTQIPKPVSFFSVIPFTMSLVAWKQSQSRFSDQLGCFSLENSMKFVLLKFNLLCFVLIVSSRLLYILVLDFFFFLGGGEYLSVSTSQQPQNVNEMEVVIRLECTNIPKIMVWRAFV